jgi:hypothetical protein
MPITGSGEIALIADIEAEFDQTGTTDISLFQARDDAGLSSGEVSMTDFYGLSDSTAPSVTTNALSGATTSSITASGNVTSDGGATITERGFYFGTNSAAAANNTKYTVSGTTGTYSRSFTGLGSSTTYYCWAYATNSAGTTIGSRVNLATLTPYSPTVVQPASGSGFYFGAGDPSGTYYIQYLNPQTNSYDTYATTSWNAYQAQTRQSPGTTNIKAFQNTTTRYYLSFVPNWFTFIQITINTGSPCPITKASATGGTNNPSGFSATNYANATNNLVQLNTNNTTNGYYAFLSVTD